MRQISEYAGTRSTSSYVRPSPINFDFFFNHIIKLGKFSKINVFLHLPSTFKISLTYVDFIVYFKLAFLLSHELKKIIYILVIFLNSLYTSAQSDALYSQYMFNQFTINPAYAGSRDALSTVCCIAVNGLD